MKFKGFYLFIAFFFIINSSIFKKLNAQSPEIGIYLSNQIDFYSNKFNIPKAIIKSFVKIDDNGDIKFTNISDLTLNNLQKYLNKRKIIEVEEKDLNGNSSIDKILILVSEDLYMNFENLRLFFKTNNFETNVQNIWILSSIAFLFGKNTSFEIINYCSNITGPGFLRLMLKDQFLLKNYLCNKKILWDSFRDSLEPAAALEKRKKLLEFFSSINYCEVNNNDIL